MGLVEENIPNGGENDENMHEAANANFVGDKENDIPTKSNPNSFNNSFPQDQNPHSVWQNLR